MLYERYKSFAYSNRLPIVLCVDRCSMMKQVTSCGEKEIEIADDLVCKILWDIAQDVKMRNSVEVCYLTTKMPCKTDFRSLDVCENYYVEEYERLSLMIKNGYGKLHNRLEQYAYSAIGYYMPIVIIIGGELFDENKCLRYIEKIANTVIVKIGADIQESILPDVEIFGIPDCHSVGEFDIRLLTRYTRDAYPRNMTRNEIIDRFHNSASELRNRIVTRYKAHGDGRAETWMTTDIIRQIEKDMDDLLNELRGE